MSVEISEWIRLFQSEYLSDFIPSGGSTVKVLACPETEARRAVDSATAASLSAGLMTRTVDAAQVRSQMIDHIFFEVARQIDWADLADRWLRKHLAAAGLIIPNDAALTDLDMIADASGIDRQEMPPTIQRLISDGIRRDRSLRSEFRNAIAAYTVSRMIPTNVSPNYADCVLQWLTGGKASLKELKNLRIYQRIGRQHGRSLLVSLARWIHSAGYPGLCIVLDLTAVYQDRDGCVRYTRNAILDLYEMLRQFIDSMDATSRIGLIAVATEGIIDDDKRSYHNYDAFRLRVENDVRDRKHDNPLNVLVRIAEAS